MLGAERLPTLDKDGGGGHAAPRIDGPGGRPYLRLTGRVSMSNPRDLVQLRALYQAGLLTEDEYTDARRRLLGYKVKRVRPGREADHDTPRSNNDLPLLFALAALAVVAIAATVWFLLG